MFCHHPSGINTGDYKIVGCLITSEFTNHTLGSWTKSFKRVEEMRVSDSAADDKMEVGEELRGKRVS